MCSSDLIPCDAQTIWIVGASQGIGLELVKTWLAAGHHVIASARSAQKSPSLLDLQAQYDTLHCLDMDVSDREDVIQKCHQAWWLNDGLDMWFYNVGDYQPMTLAQWDWSTYESMNQVNYLGVVSIMTVLAPLFKQQGHGRWVWNASLASYFGLPYGGGYSAPKAALVNLAESLQPELAQTGIQLQIINHGFVKTRLTEKNTFDMPGLVEPTQAAHLINKGLQKSSGFEIRFPFGLRVMLSLLKILPYRWSLAMTKKMLRQET